MDILQICICTCIEERCAFLKKKKRFSPFIFSDPVVVEFTTKASFIVEDLSERIFLVCNQKSDIQTILKLSDADWRACESQAEKSGELLYLNGRTDSSDVFDTYCQMYPSRVLCQFHCLCRPFKNEEKTDHGLRKFYCIEVKRRQ